MIYLYFVVTTDVCIGSDFTATCQPDEVIVMDTSELGRMESGRCIPADRGHFGCKDDVLYLTDRWCSGRQSCEFYVPNKELIEANTNCVDLRIYFRASYSCMQGIYGYQLLLL